MKPYSGFWRSALLAGMLPLAACGDFFEVTNPGPIEDEKLNSADAVPGLVAGMSSDLSIRFDDLIMLNSVAADELAHGGSYTAPGLFYRGRIRPEDVNFHWAGMQRARWVAENGIERMKNIPNYRYGTDVHSARANLFAGFSNRTLGENVCFAVIDGGPKQDFKVHFSRAEAQFTEALRIAESIKNRELTNAALAGRASVLAWQGKWDQAVQDAAQVPTSFVINAVFSENSARENNDLVVETHERREYTVYNTQWASVFRDPRVPWDTVYTAARRIQNGQDGKTPFFRQKKMGPSRGADIALAKGTEMRMLQAEAALRKNDIEGAFALINEQRKFYGMAPLTAPATLAEAWKTLQKERGAVLWLEGRRFWDLRRWFEESGPAHNAFLKDRDKCIPISQEEMDANPALRG
ncbi:MAG TPA: RagB/SusD family nutrient uptake outer membrane protein [Longimicrobiaceae bacterium]|nr:RagB/SusD family nutrient uptake outer membrane protein [Longimicrobiaceae bacterium]